jgi:hypothetical protein
MRAVLSYPAWVATLPGVFIIEASGVCLACCNRRRQAARARVVNFTCGSRAPAPARSTQVLYE